MLRYITAQLPHVFYNQPTPINTRICGFNEIQHADISTVLNLITLYVPLIDEVLVNNYEDDEFITQVIDIVGLPEYSEQVGYVINYLSTINNRLHKVVTIINKLVSFTSMDKINSVPHYRPYLGHLFKLPINVFIEDGIMSNDALEWFLSIYTPDTLHKLVTHDMRHVGKELLQRLLDITVRDYEYLNNTNITDFVSTCIHKDCDLSDTNVLLPLLTGVPFAIIRYRLTGKLPGARNISYLDLIYCSDSIWETNLGKEFFTAYVDDDMKKKMRHEFPNVAYHGNLHNLLK